MARRRNPVLSIVTNPPKGQGAPVIGQVHSITYRHTADGHDYIHEFGPSVDMKALDDGYLSIKHGSGDVLHRVDESGQTFLVNPPSRRTTMAGKRLPPRIKTGPRKGQFRKRAKRKSTGKRRRNPHTTTARRRPNKMGAGYTANRGRNNWGRASPNPRRKRMSVRGIGRDLMQGGVDAALILTGKAAARTIPAMFPNMPKEGNTGLAVQALVAVAIGLAADMVLRPAQSKMILAGGLTAPVETLVVSLNVPFLADALAPVTADQQLSAYYGYVQPPQLESGVGAYVQEGADMAMGGYDYALDA